MCGQLGPHLGTSRVCINSPGFTYAQPNCSRIPVVTPACTVRSHEVEPEKHLVPIIGTTIYPCDDVGLLFSKILYKIEQIE